MVTNTFSSGVNTSFSSQLNTNFSELEAATASRKQRFNMSFERIPNRGATGYFTGDNTVLKIPINNALSDITTCHVNLSAIIKNSSAPTYILEYSTNNSSWSTMTGTVLVYASNAALHATGYVTGLTTNDLYIRLRQSAGTSTPIITSLDISYSTVNGASQQGFAYKANAITLGDANDVPYSTSTASTAASAVENIWPVDIVPPTGSTITSIGVYGAIEWDTLSNSSTNTMNFKYSTDDASSWSSFAETNCTTASGSAGSNHLMAGYAMSTGLSLSKAKVSISQTGNANSTTNNFKPIYIGVFYSWA